MNNSQASISFTGVLQSIQRVLYQNPKPYAMIFGIWGLVAVLIGFGARAVNLTLVKVLFLFLGSLLAFLFFYSLVVRLFAHHLQNEDPGIGTHFIAVVDQFPYVVLWFFLFILCLFGLPLCPSIPLIVAFGFEPGIWVFLLGGLVVLWYLSFTSYFVLPEYLSEQTSLSDAFRRSKELMDGFRLQIFGYNLFVFVLPAGAMFLGGLYPVINENETTIWIQFSLILGLIILIYTIISAGLMSTLYIHRKGTFGDVSESEFLRLFD